MVSRIDRREYYEYVFWYQGRPEGNWETLEEFTACPRYELTKAFSNFDNKQELIFDYEDSETCKRAVEEHNMRLYRRIPFVIKD
jgi:hypothetical protein